MIFDVKMWILHKLFAKSEPLQQPGIWLPDRIGNPKLFEFVDHIP